MHRAALRGFDMAMINYTTVFISRELVRFDCEVCGAVWYVDNKQLDYQSFVTCCKCSVCCEIEDQKEKIL